MGISAFDDLTVRVCALANFKHLPWTIFQVPKPMKGPIHIYYQLENFYQNHRR